MALVVDTGILYALADRDDAWHRKSKSLLAHGREHLIAPATVLPEAAYLIRTRLGAGVERAFALSIVAGELAVEPLVASDYARVAELLEQYPEIGFVDASVVATAERLRLDTLATTDRRHFAPIRPRHAPSFTLVP